MNEEQAKMDDMTKRIIAEVRPFSMVPDEGLACTIKLTLDAINADIPGDLVECGTWKGGSSFAMLLAQRYAYGEIRRPVWMYDSFQGMGETHEPDGEHARWWKERSLTLPEDPDGQNFCIAPVEKVVEGINHFGLAEYVRIHAGWFQDTLAGKPKPDQIAVLRIDCDWYEPCQIVYRELGPLISVGGRVIVDDYYAWEGCILATHEYLAANKLPWIIRTIPGENGCWMLKTPETW